MKQITEDYCSFEISKLLKEKGFDENCHALYDVNTKQIDIKNVGDVFNNKQWENYISAPTQSFALKWLREVHQCLIVIGNKNGNYLYLIKDLKANVDLGISNDEYVHYEQAVEAACLYVLKNLI